MGRGRDDIDAVNESPVNVELEVERRTGAVNGDDAGAVGLGDAPESELTLGGVALPAHHLGDEDGDDP